MKNAVVLFSGGLDSTTCLAYANAQGFNCFALSFDYGQKHYAELQAAISIAKSLKIPHQILKLPNIQFNTSALTNSEVGVSDFDNQQSIPVTYVPARNTIFLSFALAWAEVMQAQHIFIGVSAIDYSGYPDCRPEYIAAYEKMANLATASALKNQKLEIVTPLINLSKAETVKLGISLGVDYSKTVSCYRANEKGEACGKCDSCHLRQKGFLEANIKDPTLYVQT